MNKLVVAVVSFALLIMLSFYNLSMSKYPEYNKVVSAVKHGEVVSDVEAKPTVAEVLNKKGRIGTAFKIAKRMYLTAAHVCVNVDVGQVWTEVVALRAENKTTPIKMVLLHPFEDACIVITYGELKELPVYKLSATATEQYMAVGYPGVSEKEVRIIGQRMEYPVTAVAIAPELYAPTTTKNRRYGLECYPGMSGGPMLNQKFHVIGIVVMTLKPEFYCVDLPIETVYPWIEAIKKDLGREA